MWDICLFSYFSTINTIPSFTKSYLIELKKFFKKIVFLSSERNIDEKSYLFLKDNNIDIKYVENKGYDFGMFYQSIDLLCGCETMAFANDSVVLINDFDIIYKTIEEKQLDFSSITDNYAHKHHYQSFFWFFRPKVLNIITSYLNEYGYLERENVVEKYEIDLSNKIINDKTIKSEAVFQTKKHIDIKDLNIIKLDVRKINIEKYLSNSIPIVKNKFVYENNFTYNKDYSINKRLLHKANKVIDYSISNDIIDMAIERCESLNINDFKNKKIAIILHLYHEDMWWRLKKKIKILHDDFRSDVYISLIKNYDNKIKHIILKDCPYAKILFMENDGKDIVPFLKTIKHIKEQNIEYDYIAKIHTKRSLYKTFDKFSDSDLNKNSVLSGDSWRQLLIESIVGSKHQIKRCLFALEHYKNGMVGNVDFLYKENSKTKHINTETIQTISDKYNFGFNKNDDFYFIAGTMFWIKYKYLKDSFPVETIDKITEEIKNQKDKGNGIGFNSCPLLHSLERFFCTIIKDKYDAKIFGISPFSGC